MEKKYPKTKAELLQFVQDGRSELEAILNQVPQERMEEKGVESDWSVKDILAHISAWELKMSAAFAEALASDDPPAWPLNNQAVDDLNAQFYADNRDKSLAQVLSQFAASYKTAVTAIEAMSENDLFNPDRFPWLQGRPLWGVVAGNTFGHYWDHIPNIQAWLEEK